MEFSTHYTYRKILRSIISPVIMMICTSLYSVTDGFFLSNFAGKEAFAAVNFIIPYLMMFTSVGFMFGTGGSALIAKVLGEKKEREADEIFSTLMIFSVLTGVVLAAAGMIFLKPVAIAQGADGILLEDSLKYGKIYLLGTPASIIQYEFETLYSTAGKGKMGLYVTVTSGTVNIGLDALFLGVFSWGITGAAVATIISQWIGGMIPFIYFGRENSSNLSLIKCRPEWKSMIRVCKNGSSEMVNNISMSVVSLLYNVQLLRYAGDDGIAAYGIMMYVNFLFTAIFWGYVSGMAPVISFNYGAEKKDELKSLLRKSIVIISTGSVIMFCLAELLARPVSMIFSGYDQELLNMTTHGFRLFSISFLFAGLSLFSSSFFTALNNGLVSAILSFLRVFAFQIPAVLLLPEFFNLDGIWAAIVVAESMTVVIGTLFLIKNKKKYEY